MKVNRRTVLKLGLAATAGASPNRRRGRRIPDPEGETSVLPGLCGRPCGYHALHRVPEVRGGLQPPEPSSPHGRILLGQGRPPLLPSAHRNRVHRGEPVPREPVPGSGRPAPDLLQGPVHALPLPLLRVGVHRGCADQVRRRGRGLQSHHLHRVPILPGCLSVRDPGLRVPRAAHAPRAQVRILRRPGQRDRSQSRVRRLLSHRGAGLRPPGGPGRHGEGPPEATPGPLRQPCLRRNRSGRDLLAVPDRQAGPGGRTAEPPGHPSSTTDRGHPARDLQVRHHPRGVLRPAGRDHVVQPPEASGGQSARGGEHRHPVRP